MPKIIAMRGLPGSLKTTYALAEMKKSGNMLRVNRDDLRAMLHGKDAKWSPAREKATVLAEESIVDDALDHNLDVIVDDTNILGKGTDKWRFRVSNSKTPVFV